VTPSGARSLHDGLGADGLRPPLFFGFSSSRDATSTTTSFGTLHRRLGLIPRFLTRLTTASLSKMMRFPIWMYSIFPSFFILKIVLRDTPMNDAASSTHMNCLEASGICKLFVLSIVFNLIYNNVHGYHNLRFCLVYVCSGRLVHYGAL